MKYTTTLRKSGNSRVFPVPAAALKELGVDPGTEFTMTVEDGKVVLERAQKLPTRDDVFAALAAADHTIPEDIRIFQEAPPQGKEIW